MRVWFSQFYIEPAVDFPFSHLLQKRLSKEVTQLVKPSAIFIAEYGEAFEIMFRISAKQKIQDNEIRGPTVFRKTRDVEYTVFLPFDVIMQYAEAPKIALQYLIKGACGVFETLEIDTTRLREAEESLIEGICADPTMLEGPSLQEEENELPQREAFTKFFEKT